MIDNQTRIMIGQAINLIYNKQAWNMSNQNHKDQFNKEVIDLYVQMKQTQKNILDMEQQIVQQNNQWRT